MKTILFCHHIGLIEREMWLSVFLFRNQEFSGANMVDRGWPSNFLRQPVSKPRFEFGSSLRYLWTHWYSPSVIYLDSIIMNSAYYERIPMKTDYTLQIKPQSQCSKFIQFTEVFLCWGYILMHVPYIQLFATHVRGMRGITTIISNHFVFILTKHTCNLRAEHHTAMYNTSKCIPTREF